MNDQPETVKQVIERYFPGGFTLRDEANAIVAYAIRNGPIEDLHAGKTSDLLSDPALSRLTEDDIKNIMIFASKSVEKLLREKEEDSGSYYVKIMDYNVRYCRGWER